MAPRLSWSGKADVKVGDTVELHLDIETLTALRGMPLQLAFPADRLQLTDASEGVFFKQDGAPTSFSKSGDGKNGKLNVGILRNQATAIGGKGNVLTLYFKALAKGTAEVAVTSAQAIGLGAPAPSPVLPPSIAVQIHQ
jgi:general secretion pathway protein D